MGSSTRARLLGWGSAVLAGLALLWWGLPRPTAGSSAPVQPLVIGPTGTPIGPITFVGDSLTAGGNWQAAFPAQTVFNAGVGGDTTLHLLARLPAIRQTGAHTYLLMVGINDLMRGFNPGAVASRIQWIRAGLQLGTGARVITQSTISCTRPQCGDDTLRKVTELNRLLQSQTPPGDFLDLNTVLADEDGLKQAYSTDGVHLNALGYVLWQERLRTQLFTPGPRPPS